MSIQKIVQKYGKNDTFFIAEIGNNHMGKVELAKEMIDAALNSGASAVKFQKRNNKNLFQEDYANIPYIGRNSFGNTYLEHRENLELSIDQFCELKRYSEDRGILFFATPFDEESLVELETIGCELYKVASADIVNHSLLEAIAKTGKPVIVSTGGASFNEINEAVEVLNMHKASLALLQCTASYPVEIKDMELRVISKLKEMYPNIPIGLSDHQSGISMALIAYMLGARIFEKHFTLHRSWKGTDQSFSLEPEGFRKMVRDLLSIELALGSGEKKQLEVERDPIYKMRKSILLKRDLLKGHIITRDDVEFRCPLNGLPISELKNILGIRLLSDLPKGHVLKKEDLN